MIAVVGGCYAEVCLQPSWDYIYGSAGRAAAALSTLTHVELHTLLSTKFQKDFLFLMAASDVTHRFVSQECSVTFQYLHPLASPLCFVDGEKPPSGSLNHVRAENILVFGMVEYTPTVHGTRVVYDPQSNDPVRFSQTGSTARELVYVLNQIELESLAHTSDLDEGAKILIASEGALAVVVKRGPSGATIFTPEGNSIYIPCYRARRVFKIGSGDMFAAAFAYFWQEAGETIADAADLASRVRATPRFQSNGSGTSWLRIPSGTLF
jgi:hypothetical protein